jgi:WD40 repeat protein
VDTRGTGPWELVSEDGDRVTLVVSGDAGELAPDRPYDDQCARWSPDGKWVAVLDPRGLCVATTDGKARLVMERRVEQYTPVTPHVTDIPTQLYSSISCPTWIGPDAMVVDHFTGSFPERIELIKDIVPGGTARDEELDTTSVLRISDSGVDARVLPSRWSVVAVSPDSATAVLSFDDRYSLVDTEYLLTGQGAEPLQIEDCSSSPETGQTFPCSGVYFSPDSKRLVYDYAPQGGGKAYDTGASLRVWDIATRSMILSLERTPEQSSFGDLIWSPDGKALAYARGWQKPDIFVALVEEGHVVKLPIEYTFELGTSLVGWLD